MLYQNFKRPPAEYTTVPFWFWNHHMDKKEISRQLELMCEQHVLEAVIHARHGLITEYFSEEWFACIEHTLNEGKRLGMRFWLYDESNWPSGYAGGRVLAENEDFCGKHLIALDYKADEMFNDEDAIYAVAAFSKNNDGSWSRLGDINVPQDRRVYAVRYTHWKVAYGEDYYVDLLNPKATEAFMRVTHREYFKRFGAMFGNVLRGFFSDEAGFYNGLQLPWSDRTDDNSLVWTDALPEYFAERCGYDLVDSLPYLFEFSKEKSPKIRHNFYDTVCELYRESFLRPQRIFCEEHGVKLIGHLHYEDYMHLQVGTQGDFTKALSEFTYAGVDRIEYCPGAISEKLTSSVAWQYDKERSLSETFAQGGWDFSLADMRRWTDFQLVRGINLFVVHAFFYSIEDFRRDDAPPTFFYQNPAYRHYSMYSDYTARLCALLSSGKPVCDLAVYYPMPSAQVVYDPSDREVTRTLDRDVQEIVKGLMEAQYELCLINDEAFVNENICDNMLKVGKCSFKALAVPAKWLPFGTLECMYSLALSGMPIVFLRHKPMCIEYEKRTEFDRLMKEMLALENVAYVEEYYFYRKFTYRFAVQCLNAAKGFERAVKPLISLDIPNEHIICTARSIDGITTYFIVNESDAALHHTVTFPEKGTPVIWNAEDGTRSACEYCANGNSVSVDIVFAPYSSVLIVFGDEEQIETTHKTRFAERIALDGKWSVTLGDKTFNEKVGTYSNEKYGYIEKICYEYTFNVDNYYDKAVISFGNIHNICDIKINRKAAGTVMWKPYRLETDLLQAGENRITVTVYATPAGAIGEKARPFGIKGPVYVDLLKFWRDCDDTL